MNEQIENLANRIAKYFQKHLLEELKKPSAQKQEFDGRVSLDINREILSKMGREFPELENEPEPRFNLFRKWFELNLFPIPYEEFCIEAYNIIFFERILCLKYWSEKSIQNFHDVTKEVFSKFNYKRDGFSVSNFLTFENNMRELLREIMTEFGREAENAYWPVLYSQSVKYQATVNEFFENILKEAFAESERLINNILPVKISGQLKKDGRVKPVSLQCATVLFTDFKGFTQISEKMSPEELVSELDECFSVFDSIIEKFGLEKIKTIGDSFMCAGGVPEENKTHVFDTALAAISMKNEICKMADRKKEANLPFWEVRIGFHTGPLIAGVIGQKKFSYDIWGDTVNTASRMESSGEPGRINISHTSAKFLLPFFELTHRGEIHAKNKQPMQMYFLERLKSEYSADSEGTVPNEKFFRDIKNSEISF